MDYTIQLDTLITSLSFANDCFFAFFGILGFLIGLLIVLIFSFSWR